MEALLDARADPNITDAAGTSPLMWAAAGRTLRARTGVELEVAENEAVRQTLKVACLRNKDAVCRLLPRCAALPRYGTCAGSRGAGPA